MPRDRYHSSDDRRSDKRSASRSPERGHGSRNSEKNRDVKSHSDRSKRSSSRERKRHHHHHRDRSPKVRTSTDDSYGKYGIIYEQDLSLKDTEFRLWLEEVRKLDYDRLSTADTRRYFKDFVEDFNTATMPSRKYYDLEAYEKKKKEKNAKHPHRTKESKSGSTAESVAEMLRRDMQELHRGSERHASSLATPGVASYYSPDQLEEMRRSELDRIRTDKLRRMGHESI